MLIGGNRQEMTWVHYVPHATQERKLEVLRMTEEVYFDSLHECHELIESYIVERGS